MGCLAALVPTLGARVKESDRRIYSGGCPNKEIVLESTRHVKFIVVRIVLLFGLRCSSVWGLCIVR